MHIQANMLVCTLHKCFHKAKICQLSKVIMMAKFVNQYYIKYVIKERHLRLAVSLVYFTCLKNLPIEKDKPMSRLTNQYKACCERNGSNVSVGVGLNVGLNIGLNVSFFHHHLEAMSVHYMHA